ncbi:Kinesin-like protein [Forsythia ovata]|uniref:Kinesin-like protein n=1 Tax=Forsythia ovata TaxID=205694 RepID=A0ABD1UD35_9LAMI
MRSDRVFSGDCSTREVYEEGTKEIAISVVGGINYDKLSVLTHIKISISTTIFAYGQTSSGKTYTMNGITEYSVANNYDYIQRLLKNLFNSDNTPLRLLDDPDVTRNYYRETHNRNPEGLESSQGTLSILEGRASVMAINLHCHKL